MLIAAPNERIHSEKLLVHNEQERKFKDIEKLEREGLKVWQKEKVSMPNRAGAVAAVRNIPRHKAAKLKSSLQPKAADEEGQQNKGKINIFEAQDSTILKREVLNKMGYGSDNERQALVPLRTGGSKSQMQLATVETRSQLSHSSSVATLDSIDRERKNRKAIDYLQKGKEGKESVKDFIDLSRAILRAQISINSKTEENERLQEYIAMETEKLEVSYKFLQEDKEKFEKLMNDGEKAAKNVADQVKQKTLEKNKLIQEIEKVQTEINAVESSCKKIEDDLIVSKHHKKFLDILAIQANLKEHKAKRAQKGGGFNN